MAGDLDTDVTDETTPAFNMNSKKGDDYVPVTREGHNAPSEEYHHGVEEVDKTAGCPPGIGEQMPLLTYSSSDTESGSSHEESEILPPRARKDGEMGGEIVTKGYNIHLIVVWI